MKQIVVAAIILAGAVALGGCASDQWASNGRQRTSTLDSLSMMSKQDVISLSQAGVSDSLIISMLDMTGSYFRLTTQDVLDLKNAGVHDGVIKEMMSPPPQATQSSDNGRYYYYYPPYWYAGYYPYWDPWWYYPSFSLGVGFGYHYPIYTRHFYSPHYVGHGFGGGHRAGGFHGGGRHR